MLTPATLALALLAGPAEAAPAAPDLRTAYVAPAGMVYQTARHTVTVSNPGSASAAGVKITIDLPATHTSPQVYVLGSLGAKDSRCTLAGTRLTCNVGTLAKRGSTSVWFDLAPAYSTAPLVVTADATTTTYEPVRTNNTVSRTLAPTTYSVAVAAPLDVHADHCTGTGLTSYYECTLFPSSISGFDATLEPGGAMTIPGADPGFVGVWSQPASDRLVWQLYDGATLYATLDARGVDGGCFEGVMTFVGSTYVAPYEVCPL